MVRKNTRYVYEGKGFTEEEMRKVDFLAQGFQPEGGIDLVLVSRALRTAIATVCDADAALARQGAMIGKVEHERDVAVAEKESVTRQLEAERLHCESYCRECMATNEKLAACEQRNRELENENAMLRLMLSGRQKAKQFIKQVYFLTQNITIPNMKNVVNELRPARAIIERNFEHVDNYNCK